MNAQETELYQAWKLEEQQPFTGWDFSYLDGRMIEEQAPGEFGAFDGRLEHRHGTELASAEVWCQARAGGF